MPVTLYGQHSPLQIVLFEVRVFVFCESGTVGNINEFCGI